MNSIIIFCAKYLFIVVVLIIAWAWLRADRKTKPRMAAAIILAGILALVVSRIAGKLYYDPRPFVTNPNVKPLIKHIADNGFPSDHALLTMTLTAALYFWSRRWTAAALVFTLIVGAARVLAHLHSPIDIIGAWLISIVAAIAAFYTVNHLAWFNQPKAEKKPETQD